MTTWYLCHRITDKLKAIAWYHTWTAFPAMTISFRLGLKKSCASGCSWWKKIVTVMSDTADRHLFWRRQYAVYRQFLMSQWRYAVQPLLLILWLFLRTRSVSQAQNVLQTLYATGRIPRPHCLHSIDALGVSISRCLYWQYRHFCFYTALYRYCINMHPLVAAVKAVPTSRELTSSQRTPHQPTVHQSL